VRVEFEGGKVEVHGRYKGIPVGATATIDLDNSDYAHVDAVLDYVTIAGIPLPGLDTRESPPANPLALSRPQFPRPNHGQSITVENGRLLVS